MTITNAYLLTALACIGGILFGFDISSMSAIIVTPNYLVYFAKDIATPNPDHPGWLLSNGPDSLTQGGITASMAGGSWLGALSSGPISDRFGRRGSITVALIIYIVGSVIICASQNIAMLIVGRIIAGWGIGISSAQVPVYLSELAPPKIRGRLVGCQQWAITWGICIFYYVSYGCSNIGQQDGISTASWRTPWGLQMVPAVAVLCFVPFMPRSPRWLASKGRWEEAFDVLVMVHGHGDKSHPLVLAEYEEIKAAIEAEKSSSAGYSQFLQGNMLNRIHIAVFTQIWSQLTGMNVMMYYISYIFDMAGIATGTAGILPSSIQYVINVAGTVPALIWMDRWGRRRQLLIGSTLMGIFMFANAGILASYGEPHVPGPGQSSSVTWTLTNNPNAGRAVIAMTYLFVASYAPTWGPVSWVYPPELFPTALRGKANSISTSANWIFNFALGFFTPPAFKNIQWKTYILFGIFNTLMTIHVFLLFPETKGKTLEEVEEVFESNVPAWRTRELTNRSRLDEIANKISQNEAGPHAVTSNDEKGSSSSPGSEKGNQLA